jgi:hypothetical protein
MTKAQMAVETAVAMLLEGKSPTLSEVVKSMKERGVTVDTSTVSRALARLREPGWNERSWNPTQQMPQLRIQQACNVAPFRIEKMTTTIMPAWIKEKTPEGVLCIPGSQPQKDSKPTLIPNEDIQSVTESEHQQDGLRFAIIILKTQPPGGTN